MIGFFKKMIWNLFYAGGYVLLPAWKDYPFYPDMEKDFRESYTRNKKYTMTSMERMYAMYKATEYIIENKIEGAIVECGVWKGGSAMVGMDALLRKGVTDREFWLYDTYEGMSKPTEKDIMHSGMSAKVEWDKLRNELGKESSSWCLATEGEVENNVLKTRYPKDHIVMVKGKVEETIPAQAPHAIALLRLDTDWYESTKHELEHLFPRLSIGGVLIIDDYGCWRGARQAVDEYFSKHQGKVFLQRIDYSGRIAVKMSD